LPTTTELRKIELGREDLIPQACYKNSKKYDVLLDEDSNGTADLFESEDYVTRKGNMLFDGMKGAHVWKGPTSALDGRR
jgi:hypothetical protein